MFTNAIVKTPCQAMTQGITTAELGQPDHALALLQHQNYIAALQHCGLQVTVLAADENFPDSCFVEDPAIITPKGALITHPGANSRQGETQAIKSALGAHFTELANIEKPGALDGGDVMMVGNHYYIGLSDRTNEAGAAQLISWLQQHGMHGSTVKMTDMLHLKTGVSYLENNVLIATGEFVSHPAFEGFDVLEVLAPEAYAANCIWVNNKVIMPVGFPATQAMLEQAGFEVLLCDVSEFQKLDGGLSCLSLRF